MSSPSSDDEVAWRAAELVQQGLDKGLVRQVAQLFDVLVSETDAKAAGRFQRGLDKAIASYLSACAKLIDGK